MYNFSSSPPKHFVSTPLNDLNIKKADTVKWKPKRIMLNGPPKRTVGEGDDSISMQLTDINIHSERIVDAQVISKKTEIDDEGTCTSSGNAMIMCDEQSIKKEEEGEKSKNRHQDENDAKKSNKEEISPGAINQKHQQGKSGNRISVNSIFYTPLALLGRGGSSKVYQVLSPSGKLLALKKVSTSGIDKSTLKSYIKEYELIQQLAECDGVINVYGMETTSSHLLIVMECGEIDLAHLLQDRLKKGRNYHFIRWVWDQVIVSLTLDYGMYITNS
jgi:hypothetical protein